MLEDKRTDITDEFVPVSDETDEISESDEVIPISKRKLGDSLRLGKKSAFWDDEKFGRHARLFEQMRLGKRSSESAPSRDKKKINGNKLQLVRATASVLFFVTKIFGLYQKSQISATI